MKKILLAIALLALSIPFAFANGNAERITAIEGEAVMSQRPDGVQDLQLRLRDGSLVQVGIDRADLERLQLRDRERIRIEGVYLGESPENRLQARILARTMTVNGQSVTLENPMRLTEQERERLRTYERQQQQTGASETAGSDSAGDSGGGTSGGSGTGSPSGSGTEKGKKN